MPLRYLQLAAELVGLVLLGVVIVGPIDYYGRNALLGDERAWIESLLFGGSLGAITWIGDRVRNWHAGRHDTQSK